MKEDTGFLAECLQELSVMIGERPTGSASNRRAEQYIGSVFKAHGLETEHQAFDCLDWEGGSATLRMDGVSIPTAISPYSLPCAVTAPFTILETPEALREANLSGRVAVLGGELTKEAIMPKNFTFWNPEHHREVVRLLEEKAPEAIITVSFSKEHPLPIFEDGDLMIPSAVVAGKYFEAFKAATTQSLELQMRAERRPSKGANVIARNGVPGKTKVVVMAHFDTKPGTPGALDNAAGVAVLLQLSKLLSENPVSGSVELVAMNGEDYFSNPGQMAYLEAFEKSPDQASLVINCDGAGYKVGKTGVSTLNCPEGFVRQLDQKLEAFPALRMSAPWYQGDHMIFAPWELPTIAITSEEIFPLIDEVIHTEKDTVELINAEYLRQTAAFIYEVIRDQ